MSVSLGSFSNIIYKLKLDDSGKLPLFVNTIRLLKKIYNTMKRIEQDVNLDVNNIQTRNKIN